METSSFSPADTDGIYHGQQVYLTGSRLIEEEAIKAIKDSQYHWRTIDGISEALGIDPERVGEIIVNSSKFIKNSKTSRSGKALYGVRKDYLSHTPTIARFAQSLAGVVL
jgi:hypothetical protein